MDSVGFEGGIEDIRGGAIGEAARLAKAAALDDTRTWVDPRGYTLSERIWSARQSDRVAIQQILREAIAAGEDPVKTARRLEVYLTPEGRRLTTTTPPIRRGTPEEYRSGKGSYAARRLARTEITRAHGQATIQAAADNEFVVGLRWNLSPSHPKVDICDELASRDRGLGPGVYPADDVPRYPAHPQCLCNLSPVVAEDAIDRIVAETRAARVAASSTVVENAPAEAAEWIRRLDEIRGGGPLGEVGVRQAGAVVREEIYRRRGSTVQRLSVLDDEISRLTVEQMDLRGRSRMFGSASLDSQLADVTDRLEDLYQRRAAFDVLRSAEAADPLKADRVRALITELEASRYGSTSRQTIVEQIREEAKGLQRISQSSQLREEVRDVLSEIRPFGSDVEHPWNPASNPGAVFEIEKVREYLPRDWWERSASHGPLRVFNKQGGGHYSHDRAEIALTESTGLKGRVNFHEFAHRVEALYPEIGRIEAEFYARRTRGEAAGGIPGLPAHVRVRIDKFADPYIGRDYGDPSAWEILSMGIEDVFGVGGQRILEYDQEMLDLILGILATV